MDDKYGSEHEADDMAVWSDDASAPNYGAILRICQDSLEGASGSGGVWGAHIEQTVALRAGRTYSLSFWAAALDQNSSDPECVLQAAPAQALQVQLYGQSSGELLSEAVTVAGCSGSCGSTHDYQLVAPADENAVLEFYFGGQWTKLKLSVVQLDESEAVPVESSSAVSVNQLGYLRSGPKLATLRSPSATALPWELHDAGGATLATGTSLPFGADALSGDTLQRVDFSAFTGAGTGLRLIAGGASSAPFAVADDVYAGLARDSWRFYYHQRCGQALALPEAEQNSLVRSADHAGDSAASCSAGQSCTVGYPLDVSKGWHDAGDFGKYVITGAVSTWTLLNAVEHARHWGTVSAPFTDGQLNTAPANGISDLLDEARHELDFLLGMQVPEGNPLAGMAHHKLHSDDWVPMPTYPGNDGSVRYLRPPSTAATLDLAAVAAQCSRIWRDLDPVFAARCANAAERAWAAAQAHPDQLAPANSNVGGGPYDDTYLGDEFYWAAAELLISTGRSEFADYVRSSSHRAGFNVGTGSGPFSWPGTAGLGTISLALVPNALSDDDVREMRQGIVEEAELYLNVEAQNGYAVPLSGVIWGSNGDVLNAGILLALAYDLTASSRYLAGATSALDYVLGNNPLQRSYVTGYGTSPVSKIHHTMFAPYLDAGFPAPPPGFIVGGPNASLDAFENPGVAPGCSPLRCWSETSGAYWFIEVAINWNAPLGWLSSWLDQHGQHPRTTPVAADLLPAEPNGSGGTTGAGGSAGEGAAAGAGSLSGDTTLDSSAVAGSGAGAAAGQLPQTDVNCGCRTSTRGSNSGAAALLLLLGIACARRRTPAS